MKTQWNTDHAFGGLIAKINAKEQLYIEYYYFIVNLENPVT